MKDLVRPPFANYDIVVYFGCGLFAVPFILHYMGTPSVKALAFDYGLQPPFVAALVTTLTLLFSVYLLGHFIAFLGSVFIEQAMDSTFGKTSVVIFRASRSTTNSNRNRVFRAQLKSGLKGSFKRSTWLSGTVRAVAHAPALPFYIIVYLAGAFGFYRTRITKDVLDKAETLLSPICGCAINSNGLWYKALEAYVINNNSSAVPRMYNYLVIAGLFRSLSVVFLATAWLEVALVILSHLGFTVRSGLLAFSGIGIAFNYISYIVIIVAFLFSLFSYLKFQRRYVEEAIFSFTFTA